MTAQEELARYKRALPIVWALIAAGIDSHLAAKADPGTEEENGKDSKDWKLAAQMAEVKDDYVPGTETQLRIIRLLQDYEKAVARVRNAQTKNWTPVHINEATGEVGG